MGCSSKPGADVGTRKNVRPRCLATSRLVRVRRKTHSDSSARLVKIFWPSMRQPSPSRTARVARRGDVGAGVGLGVPEGDQRLAAQQLRAGSPAAASRSRRVRAPTRPSCRCSCRRTARRRARARGTAPPAPRDRGRRRPAPRAAPGGSNLAPPSPGAAPSRAWCRCRARADGVRRCRRCATSARTSSPNCSAAGDGVKSIVSPRSPRPGRSAGRRAGRTRVPASSSTFAQPLARR